MIITCPHCGFSRQIDPDRVPDRPVRITCPSCRERFRFTKGESAETAAGESAAAKERGNLPFGEATETPIGATAKEMEEAVPGDEASSGAPAGPDPAKEAEEPIRPEFPGQVAPTFRCPACGLEQPVGERCRGCGVLFVMAGAAPQGYAGFWIRALAAVVDSVLVTVVQVVLGFTLGMAAGALGALGRGDEAAMALTTWLFGSVLAIAYYVFFTGYCGQTPGKMAVRVKVIRTDGSEIGYGRAALREVPGKFISGILFGIGYLMVAFDSRKQGLHDKIADTYVIKI